MPNYIPAITPAPGTQNITALGLLSFVEAVLSCLLCISIPLLFQPFLFLLQTLFFLLLGLSFLATFAFLSSSPASLASLFPVVLKYINTKCACNWESCATYSTQTCALHNANVHMCTCLVQISDAIIISTKKTSTQS